MHICKFIFHIIENVKNPIFFSPTLARKELITIYLLDNPYSLANISLAQFFHHTLDEPINVVESYKKFDV